MLYRLLGEVGCIWIIPSWCKALSVGFDSRKNLHFMDLSVLAVMVEKECSYIDDKAQD